MDQIVDPKWTKIVGMKVVSFLVKTAFVQLGLVLVHVFGPQFRSSILSIVVSQNIFGPPPFLVKGVHTSDVFPCGLHRTPCG